MGIAPDDHIDLLNVRHVAPAHDDAEGNAALEEPWSVQRDRGAADRDRTAQARDETALDRDLEQARADQRARTRDRAAAERDCAAQDRDLKAARLDHSEGDADEQTFTGRRAAMDRVSAALDRELAAADREQARLQVDERSANRASAAVDRASAVSDRVEAAIDRAGAILDRQHARAELKRAQFDTLTGAVGLALGIVTLEAEMNRARRGTGRLVLAYLDVDELKAVNDRYGHAAGDALLRDVVEAVQRHLRSYDVIVRIGGDEFVCALGDSGLDDARRRFLEIRATLAFTQPQASFTVGFVALGEGDTLDQLRQRGDVALYDAKHQPRSPLPVAAITTERPH